MLRHDQPLYRQNSGASAGFPHGGRQPVREVRFEYLKGREAVDRLREKPVGFLPLGSLERHGDHLPMGLDVLKAHAICCECARQIGGVVFPPHFYSAIHLYKDQEHLKRMPLHKQQQRIHGWVRNWCNMYTDETAEEHLREILENFEMMGVRVLVLYTGHYPSCQLNMVKRLAERFNRKKRSAMKVIPFAEPWFFGEGDHAGKWETSLFMALCPEHVDMRRIGPRNFEDHGWDETRDPRRASAEFGRIMIRRIAGFLQKEVNRCLAGRKRRKQAETPRNSHMPAENNGTTPTPSGAQSESGNSPPFP